MESIQLSLFEGKECIKCGWQPIAHFGKDTSKKDGLQTRCKECINAYLRGRYHEDIDASRKYYLEKYHARPEIYKPIHAKSQKKPKARAQRNKWQRIHYQTHGRILTPHQIERRRANNGVWKRQNKDKVCRKEQKRRALRMGSSTHYTVLEWNALCLWFGSVCLACGVDELTIDHVVPLSKGGSNGIQNLQPLCRACNTRKHAKHIDYRDPDRLAAFLASLEGN